MNLVTHTLHLNVTSDSPDWLLEQRGRAQIITGPSSSLPPPRLVIQNTASLRQWSPTFVAPMTGAPMNI